MPLPGGQAATAFAQHGVIALRQGADEGIGPQNARGGDDLRARGPGLVVADIVQHGAGEQKRLLQHHGNLLTQRGLRDVAHILPAHQNPTLGHVVKPVDQRHRR